MSHDPNPNKRQSPTCPCPMQYASNPPPPTSPSNSAPPSITSRERRPCRTVLLLSNILRASRHHFFLFIRAAVRDTVLRMWHWRAFLCHLSLMLEMPTVCHLFVRFFFIVVGLSRCRSTKNDARSTTWCLPHLGAWPPSNGVSDVLVRTICERVRGFVGRACPIDMLAVVRARGRSHEVSKRV